MSSTEDTPRKPHMDARSFLPPIPLKDPELYVSFAKLAPCGPNVALAKVPLLLVMLVEISVSEMA